MQRRRISFAPPPIAPASYRGSPDSAPADGYEEDDQATLMWQGGSRIPSFAPGAQQWSDTPMAFEPPPERVPSPMPSMAPMAMDVSSERAPTSGRKHDVLAWLPLASAACVTVAVAVFLFAIAFTTTLGENRQSNASAGATITNVLPAPARNAPSPMPVIQPAITEPAITEPAIAEPAITEPAITEPAITKPTIVRPAMTESPAKETIARPNADTTAPPPPRVTAPVRRNVITPPLVAAPNGPSAPADQPVKKSTAAPRADEEAVSAQKMLEEAQRETAGAL